MKQLLPVDVSFISSAELNHVLSHILCQFMIASSDIGVAGSVMDAGTYPVVCGFK